MQSEGDQCKLVATQRCVVMITASCECVLFIIRLKRFVQNISSWVYTDVYTEFLNLKLLMRGNLQFFEN